ncbi:hypothetical protein NN561_012112 [Cricetulus griseus]
MAIGAALQTIGKRLEGPVPGPTGNPLLASIGAKPAGTILPTCTSKLYRATPGSAGLDLCATTDSILNPEDGVQILSTGISGPPHPDTCFLILGRASPTLQGLTIYPSIIDNDYSGEIKILASSRSGPISITSGQRIAQAIPLPLDTRAPSINNQEHGASSPGSSDTYWVWTISKDCPMLSLQIENKWFHGILDSGADATVISSKFWPSTWPTQPSVTHLQGIGQSNNSLQSSKLLTWRDPEGNSVNSTVQAIHQANQSLIEDCGSATLPPLPFMRALQVFGIYTPLTIPTPYAGIQLMAKD